MKKYAFTIIFLIILSLFINIIKNFIPKVITVTFSVGDNIIDKNIKAQKLSLSYTSKDGDNVTIVEGDEIKIKCLSYNNEGCKIDKLPIINANGYIVYGFSTDIGENNVDVLKSMLKQDTTLYAKVGYTNTNKVDKINIAYQKLYGNVMVEVEDGILEDDIKLLEKHLNNLYTNYPEIFYFNGKIFWLMPKTYDTVLKTSNSHIGITSGCTIYNSNYSNVFFRYQKYDGDIFATLLHEIGHAFDRSFNYNIISEREELIDLYNKLKDDSNRPLRYYSYTNYQEFYADAFSASLNELIKEKTGNYIHHEFRNTKDDIINLVLASLKEKRAYLRIIDLIQ